MQGLRDVRLVGTTDGTGAVTVTGDISVFGWLYAVEWIDGTLDNSNTAVLSVTNTPSGVDRTLLTIGAGEGDSDVVYYPRVLECDNACTSISTYAMHCIAGTLKLVIASGGAAHEGGCIVYVFD